MDIFISSTVSGFPRIVSPYSFSFSPLSSFFRSKQPPIRVEIHLPAKTKGKNWTKRKDESVRASLFQNRSVSERNRLRSFRYIEEQNKFTEIGKIIFLSGRSAIFGKFAEVFYEYIFTNLDVSLIL